MDGIEECTSIPVLRDAPRSAAETFLAAGKRGSWVCAIALVSPLLLFHAAKCSVVGRDRALQGSSELLSLIPGIIGDYMRRAFLRFTLKRCDPSASIGFGTVCTKPAASIGRNVHVGSRCQIGWANIEDDVLIASGVHITSGSKMHGTGRIDIPIREQAGVYAEVTIGEGSWIGERGVVMADVGKHCVIGAGAVVVEPIPDYSVAVGIPARVVKNRKQVQRMGPPP